MAQQGNNSQIKQYLATGFLYGLWPFVLVLGYAAPRALGTVMPMIGVLGAMGVLAYTRSIRVSGLNVPRAYVYGVAGLLGWSMLSALWSPDGGFVVERVLKLALIFVGGAGLWALAQNVWAGRGAMPRYFMCVAGSAFAFMCLASVADLMMDGGFAALFLEAPEYYNSSVLNRPLVVAVVLLWPLLFILRGHWGMILSMMLMCGAAVFLSQGQSGQLSFLVGALAFFAIPWRRDWLVWTAAAMVCLLVVVAPFLVQWLFQNAMPFFDQFSWFHHAFAGPRLEIWDFVSRHALEESPLIGFGIDATRLIGHFDSQTLYHPDPYVLHPHNFAVQIWIEFGVIGVIAFCGVIFAGARWVVAQPAELRSVYLAGFFSWLSVAATGYGIWQSWWIGTALMLWVMMGVCQRVFDIRATSSL